MGTIFKNSEAKQKILDWYEVYKKKITIPVESIEVNTGFGKTHILVGGPANGEPIFLLHGAMASAAHVLSELQYLMTKYRVYSIDVIGQSVKSEEKRISVKNNEYGSWLWEVIENLKVDKVNIIGVSWGGFVSIRAAVKVPGRINKFVLLIPAGVINGNPLKGIMKMAIPMYLYKRKPNSETLTNFMKNLLTTVDDDWKDYMGDAFLCYNMDMTVPKLVSKKELTDFKTPVFVVAADGDISFPGNKLIAQAKKIFPNIVKTELLKNAKHSPPTTDTFRKWMSAQISDFIG